MITVEEALRLVLERPFHPTVRTASLSDALGYILAEDVAADRDFPPFDRVTMDGIALSYASWSGGQRTFPLAGLVAAGSPRVALADPATALEVMTGAVLPSNTDTVVRYEDLEVRDGQATVRAADLIKGQSIHRRGSDARRGDILLRRGTIISPAEIALLASVGKVNVSVYAPPSAIVVSTGDELVALDAEPLEHQVRRSNAAAIQAAMMYTRWKADTVHLPDNEDVLHGAVSELLQNNDVLIFSGGVSKGKFDFIPSVLLKCGFGQVFHEVRQRPGKPMWFGTRPDGKFAFALPGNPVSTFMCYHQYVRSWFWSSLGVPVRKQLVPLASDFNFEPRLTHFLQVRLEDGKATPIPGGGSGDFVNLQAVDGFLELPAEKSAFRAGEAFPFLSFRQ